jgi:hypothetical protein
VLGTFSGTTCVFTFALADGLSFMGEPGFGLGVAGSFALREIADPVLRIVGVLGFNVAELAGVELPERVVLVVD